MEKGFFNGGPVIIETKRLYLRELQLNDVNELVKILCDNESMTFYPRPYTQDEVIRWVRRNIKSYKENKFGLWAVINKEDNFFIGDCGITLQNIENKWLPELGYHINKDFCNKGYATEAAKACIDYAFQVLKLSKIFTYTKVDNFPSRKVAEKNGMLFVKEFKKEVMGETVVEVLYQIENIIK